MTALARWGLEVGILHPSSLPYEGTEPPGLVLALRASIHRPTDAPT